MAALAKGETQGNSLLGFGSKTKKGSGSPARELNNPRRPKEKRGGLKELVRKTPRVLCSVVFKDRRKGIWRIDDLMYAGYNAKTFTEIVVGDASKRPVHRILQYCVVPKVGKVVDPTPYMTKNARVPQRIIDEAEKARVKLASKEATMNEVYDFLREHAGVETYEQLLDCVEATAPDEAEAARISRFVTKNILRAHELVTALIARRDRKSVQEDAKKTALW